MTDIVRRLRATIVNETPARYPEIVAAAADEIERLQKIETAARQLVDECGGGQAPPSLGALATLESALFLAWKARKGRSLVAGASEQEMAEETAFRFLVDMHNGDQALIEGWRSEARREWCLALQLCRSILTANGEE